jgi:hypothetical protein
MRSSNPPHNVALCKNLESVAIAPQFLEEILATSAFEIVTKAEHPRRSEGTEETARVRQA